MQQPHHDSVIVSPASTLRHILLLASIRAAVGMVCVIAIAGVGALPVVLPGIPAAVACFMGWRTLSMKMVRLGLCLSSAMWIGTAAAVVAHNHTVHSTFLAGSIALFAVADAMFSTMRVERVP